MKIKQVYLVLLPVIYFFLLSSCVQRDREGPRLVKIGLTHSPSHSFTQGLEVFAALLEEKTNGRYKTRIYHSAQIGNEKELQEMLTIGSLEMAVTGILNNYEPLFAVFELPFLYRDRDHALRVNTSDIVSDVSASLNDKGIKLLGFYENGFRNISNSVRPINVPDDLRGLMIRTPENQAQIETMRALGAIPTPMSFSELYTALLQGVVDGQENPLQNIWYGRLYEAQKYIAITRHIYNSVYVSASYRFWMSLPEEDREIFRECVLESSIWQMDYMEVLDEELIKRMEKEGVEFTWPDRDLFEQASMAAYDALFRQFGPRAEEIVRRIRSLD
jgi:TRAP-type transport system periplasmic protein